MIYIIGALRNPEVPRVANWLRREGFEVFDDWYGVGPEADEYWQDYEKERGRRFDAALAGAHAQNTFRFDLANIEKCDTGILILPAGKSAHLELGYMVGRGKRGYILFDKEPERYDIMYNFATGVFFEDGELLKALMSYKEVGNAQSAGVSKQVIMAGASPHR